jgi:hypothetical protein
MIRFARPEDAPNILTSRGNAKTESDCQQYDLHPNDYSSGTSTFEIDSKIYGHSSVKDALILAQHDKCFACESRVSHISFGDVEHYRPKGGYRQYEGDPLQTPGYYWLAYDWTNLFFACQICNQRFKKNLFPLQDPATRMRSHHDKANIALEQPLFIDPSTEDPEEFISFRKEIPYAVDGNIRGQTTIDALGLSRESLNDERRELYTLLYHVYLIAYVNDASPATQGAQDVLNLAMSDSARYANMVRAAMRAGFE